MKMIQKLTTEDGPEDGSPLSSPVKISLARIPATIATGTPITNPTPEKAIDRNATPIVPKSPAPAPRIKDKIKYIGR